MTDPFDDPQVTDGQTVTAGDIPAAVTHGELAYDDGATQTFTADGSTMYVESGRPTHGEWYVDDDGQFCSFWPPTYRACYRLAWMVENGQITGLRFSDLSKGSHFNGRYR